MTQYKARKHAVFFLLRINFKLKRSQLYYSYLKGGILKTIWLALHTVDFDSISSSCSVYTDISCESYIILKPDKFVILFFYSLYSVPRTYYLWLFYSFIKAHVDIRKNTHFSRHFHLIFTNLHY